MIVEESRSLSQNDIYPRSHILPITAEDLVKKQNGIDIIRGPNTRKVGSLFEEICFDSLVSSSETTVLFGPHLVDHVLMNDPRTHNMIRFDLAEFTRKGNLWSMKRLYEVKARGFSDRMIHEKLSGFSDLLSLFRASPDLLPKMLDANLREIYQTPSRIAIPENRSIEVYLLSPYLENDMYVSSEAFPVIQQRFSFPTAKTLLQREEGTAPYVHMLFYMKDPQSAMFDRVPHGFYDR